MTNGNVGMGEWVKCGMGEMWSGGYHSPCTQGELEGVFAILSETTFRVEVCLPAGKSARAAGMESLSHIVFSKHYPGPSGFAQDRLLDPDYYPT